MSSDKLSRAVAALRDEDFAAAEKYCRAVLAAEPENARAWYLCAIAQAQQQRISEALGCFETAASLAPANANYQYNLALAYKEGSQLDQAIAAYRRAVELQPDFCEARNNLGNALMEAGENRDAIACFRALVDLHPASADAHYNLANLLCDTGNEEEAIEHYRQAITLQTNHDAARENLGRALAEIGEVDVARNVWLEWLAEDPENSVARHMLAALSGDDVPDRCDDDYVRSTFDHVFAQNYDRQLARIDNRVPDMVAEAVRGWREKAANKITVNLDVLDAGCGTGLCAEFLRPLAGRLVGVDLSEDMLELAQKRAAYDEIVAAEITQYMRDHQNAFDLIVASDTLCYFGNLREVLAAAKESLKASGAFVFSLELSTPEEECEGMCLRQSGRYSHRQAYVEDCLAALGFQIASSTVGNLRKERGVPVSGIVYGAILPSAGFSFFS